MAGFSITDGSPSDRTIPFSARAISRFAFPPNSAYLFDFHTIPEARGRGLFTHCLRKMLHDLAQLPETDKIYIMVTADNGPVRHVIEKLGFNHELSLNENVRSSDSGDEPTRVIEPLRRPAGGGLLKNPAFPDGSGRRRPCRG